MSRREARVPVWRGPARLLVVLALVLTAASAAEMVAAGNAGGERAIASAATPNAAKVLGHDHAAATSPHAPRETHRTGLRIGATLSLIACALLLAWTTRRTRARQSLLWRALHGYVPRRGPPLLRLT
jgi:hypothetical protein